MKQAVKTIVFGPLHTKTSVSSHRAKMQWSLLVLILMGQCCFFMCHLYEYHFIGENKTWKEAQTYCKEKYTDLATVYDMTDMERLLNSTETQDEAWTGLYNKPGGNRMWHWSLPGLEYNDNETKWADGEPNDKTNAENCAIMNHNELWIDVLCNHEHDFICYDEKKRPNDTYCVINEEMKWLQAQKYCREHHTDLISGITQLNEVNVSITVGKVLWIGLFRDTWTWSDGRNSSFRNWDPEVPKQKKNYALLKRSGQWRSADCGERKPFFCYKEYMILIKENKTWEEALYYCRDHHYDLISITNANEQRWVQEKANNASSPYVWTGLRYTCTLEFWFWVSNEEVQYKNWKERQDECDMSGAMERGGKHQWYSHHASERFNFICLT